MFIALTPSIIKEGVSKKEEPKPESAPPLKESISKEEAQTKVASFPRKEEITPPEFSVDEARALAIANYTRAVAQRIKDNFIYPWIAKEADIQGSLMLDLRIDSTGQLLEAKVTESSGFGVLDENAVKIAKKTSPYPSFPAEINQQELWIDIPIIYKTK